MKHTTLLIVLFLTVVSAAATPTKIGDLYYTFSGTEATVTYKSLGSGEYTGDIIIPNEVTSGSKTYTVTAIDGHAFYKCSGMTSITIPNSVTTIGQCALMSCSAITSVTIPNSVTTIGDNAFSTCTMLSSVTIGRNVNKIGDNAFVKCPLTKITSLATTPPTLGSDALPNTTLTLIVPTGCKSLYAAASPWSTITNIQEAGSGTLATAISFAKGKRYVLIGKSVSLTPTILPAEAGLQSITWASSNAATAKVDDEGNVTGIAKGIATITASTTDGSSLSASFVIHVCEPGLPGDVNGDGDITIADANELINMYLTE